jgi:plastocyanin
MLSSLGALLATTISIGNFAYSQPDVTVAAAQPVTWSWTDGPHNVHVVDGPERFASDIDMAGATFTHVFTVPGVYTYQCDVHPLAMRGVIRVTG